jgi:hypothetical protein
MGEYPPSFMPKQVVAAVGLKRRQSLAMRPAKPGAVSPPHTNCVTRSPAAGRHMRR